MLSCVFLWIVRLCHSYRQIDWVHATAVVYKVIICVITLAMATAKSLESSTRPLVDGASAAAAAAAMHNLLLLVAAGRATMEACCCQRSAEHICGLQDAAAGILRLHMGLAATSCCCGATVLQRSCNDCAARMFAWLPYNVL
jgi:hypothetical protein